MSEALKKVEDFKKQVLLDLYNQCTEPQQNMFKRMHGSVETIEDDKIDIAIQQCERTITKTNGNNPKRTGTISI